MKICIVTTGPNLESEVSPVFGRAPYLLFFDLETGKFKSIPNPAFQGRRGVGVEVAQAIVSEGAQSVISGNFGPNALNALRISRIKTYIAAGLTVKEAIDRYRKGQLKEMKMPDAGPGFGSPGRRGFGPGGGRRQRRGNRGR